ncbi:hypothetical protein GW931_03070 [archaeon]|nr:hypothetical protein [archaeon]
MSTIKISHYDENLDSLIVSSIEENEKVKNNFSFDDFVISTTRRGKVVSLEIREFSEFLKEMGFNLENIKKHSEEFTLLVKPKKELLFIGVELKNSEGIRQIPVANIPLQSMKN